MKAEIEVLQPGLFSTIQDEGRFGFMKYGVPMSGPMDFYSFHLANLILNNNPGSAVMEITQMGPVLKFLNSGYFVITGADLKPEINKKEIRNYIPYFFQGGDQLRFGGRQNGCRCYLAVSGGFKTQQVFRSQSWYEGITDYFHLEKGMRLQTNGSVSIPSGNASVKYETLHFNKEEINVFPGPEYDQLPELLKTDILSRKFRIDKENNRMAVQLEEIVPNSLKPILTGPVIPGTVQLTPSGKLIILMRDCQTTGGYPRVLQLSENGMNRLAQKVQGNSITFQLSPLQ
ncbi:biotin-dependent carboxyltransferase family protein [Antarcticibacterium arcticum]|uniref:Biotin-dependent carboxyltransferase family protein n=1 Tax=Antarcticibacterium arcticum TaxID=2585771 RepID=A0A5B8YH55_9FLAO|nr:biotin-dependent carboxyltransferase family protein [Antarcticibacterium arcticum]QED36448.1 biotin-dependent carboxyltransferase family protein [Antarcticibacterium arcticum]